MRIIHISGNRHIPLLIFSVDGGGTFCFTDGSNVTQRDLADRSILSRGFNHHILHSFSGHRIAGAVNDDNRVILIFYRYSRGLVFTLNALGNLGIDLSNGKPFCHSFIFIYHDGELRRSFFHGAGNIHESLNILKFFFQSSNHGPHSFQIIPGHMELNAAAAQHGHIHGRSGNFQFAAAVGHGIFQFPCDFPIALLLIFL